MTRFRPSFPYRRRFVAAGALALVVALSACGSDSTGPGEVTDPDAALRSLALGLGNVPQLGAFTASPSSMRGTVPQLDQITVNVNGAPQTMFALGIRVTFPAGTCFESLFIVPSVTFPAGVCTPPPFGLMVMLWQTRSGSRPPDRMAFIAADVGTSSFDFLGNFDTEFFPSMAMYMEGPDKLWFSESGSLTSAVTPTSETCSVPAPPFAKSFTCNVATFNESGTISFLRVEDGPVFFAPGGTGSTGTPLTMVIPPQSFRGILQAITEIVPVTFPNFGAIRLAR